MSAGIVIPGVSQTVILILFGMYKVYLGAIATLDFSILIPMGIGVIFGSLFFLVILRFLFKYAKSYTYFGIIGFILGSLFMLYPGFNFNLEGFISIALFLMCLLIGFKLK